MKKIRSIITILLILAMSLSLVACGGDDSGAGGDGETYTIIMGGTVPDDHPISQAQFEFERVAEEMSDGRIQVEVFTNNTMGASRELVEATQAGEIQMCETSQSMYASFTDELVSAGLPFLFDNREAAYAFFDGELGTRISDEIADQTGVRILGYFENGIRMLTNNVKPISSPDDMAGLKIRVMESPLYIQMFELMGANPMPMSFSELYTALQQGTVDGQDNPYAITATNKFYEVQDYMTDLSHSFDVTALSINSDYYEALPDDLKEVVDAAAAAAVDVNRSLSIELEAEYIATIQDAGTEITFLTDEQRNVFRDVTQECYTTFSDTYSPTVTLDEVLEEAARVNEEN